MRTLAAIFCGMLVTAISAYWVMRPLADAANWVATTILSQDKGSMVALAMTSATIGLIPVTGSVMAYLILTPEVRRARRLKRGLNPLIVPTIAAIFGGIALAAVALPVLAPFILFMAMVEGFSGPHPTPWVPVIVVAGLFCGVPSAAAIAVLKPRLLKLLPPDDISRCRQCGYNLTGLTSPRCPECGRAI